ncbi:MAG: phosphate signaling complex protein PhoU, partial [Armatimonadetes bacterium]|nr:phosphate signaling complex protein PhoU [Armatimonadota bacterium]
MAEVRTQLEENLGRLRVAVSNMGALADRMLDDAIRAVTEYEPGAARKVIVSDDEADAVDTQVERDASLLIALQQPVAQDLRVIITALKSVNELERICDYGVDIAKIGRRIARSGPYKPLVDLPRLASLARAMLADTLKAFVSGDTALVHSVIEADDGVDDLYHEYRDHLIATMQQDPEVVYQAAYMLLACKYLERVGDHVVNVAEDIYYM